MELYYKRAAELNMSLEKAMKVYEKQFLDVYAMLFPAGDTSKSKETRNKEFQNNGIFFSDEEAEKVLYLCKTGQFLLNLADIKLF